MDKETAIEEVDWMRFDQFRELQCELGETKAKFFVELRSFVHDEDLEKLKEIINKYWDLVNSVPKARAIMREAFESDKGFKLGYLANIGTLLYDELGMDQETRYDLAKKILKKIFW